MVVVEGVAEGERVATSGNFLIDSQMQLAGNPSLIDVSRVAVDRGEPEFEIELPPIGPMRTAEQPPEDHDWQLPPITAPVPVESTDQERSP